MRRTLPLIAVLAGLLACSASAFAARPGFNKPTRLLESAFHVALSERAFDPAGCYPAPDQLAKKLRERTKLRVGVAAGFGAVKRPNVVYVVKRGTSCSRVILSLRDGSGLYVLDSVKGPVRKRGARNDRPTPGRAGPIRGLTLASKSFRLSRADELERLEVRCPGRTQPLGGGLTSGPPPGPDGEGIYPHSYERLGAQRGWHISVVLFDATPGDTTPRRVTIQVVCARGLVPARPTPHKTVFMRPGETKTAVARCPKGQVLFSGGFQRTNFGSPGGAYPTESRAISPKAWRVTGRAFGGLGGELTAIAYCVRNKRPLLTEVSSSTPLAVGGSATATTRPCPRGRRLTAGGFSANGSQNAFFAGGSINPDGTWSAAGFGYFGPAPSLTAYGYCLRTSRSA